MITISSSRVTPKAKAGRLTPDVRRAKLEGDDDVDCADHNCATDLECIEPPVPAASGWGIAEMILLVLTVGTLILVRRHPVRV